ncbi:MAG: DUF2971 domain-containing protein [Arcobacter sp.]|nr:MAG: DUF2971 domain-containing protein [Arcobacter sp.]
MVQSWHIKYCYSGYKIHNTYYRFRSIDRLLGKDNELEEQTIFFASPEELNDPMEGFRNIFFSGDTIVWKNLFRHYLLCLEQVSQLLIISGEEHYTILDKDIPVFKTYNDFETKEYEQLFENISTEFFEICQEFIEKVSTRTTAISSNELNMYLSSVHHIAIEIIEENFVKKNFIPERATPYSFDTGIMEQTTKMIDAVEKMILENDHDDKIEEIFRIQKMITDDIKLTRNINQNFIFDFPNRNFVLIDFVEKYINGLEILLYPKWYTSCFMTESHNSSVWGHYGDSHQGVCLIFEADQNNLLNLNGMDSSTNRKFEFKPVEYENEFIGIDFFSLLGRLPVPKLLSTWYQGDNKTISQCADGILNNTDSWRKNYWNIFHRDILTKTKDWKYENEYRLILSSIFEDETTVEQRMKTYNFNSLKGLIFGIKTSLEDKAKIFEIIKKKCNSHQRNDFKFYQAYYCHKKKNIQHQKIGFLTK